MQCVCVCFRMCFCTIIKKEIDLGTGNLNTLKITRATSILCTV